MATTPLDADQVARVAELDGVIAAEGEAVVAVATGSGVETDLIGLDFDQQTMDVLELTDGRMPADGHEIVTSPGFGEIGDSAVVDDTSFEIVGHGGTLWWSDSAVAYADLDSVVSRTGGTNRLVITAVDDGVDELRAIVDATSDVLADGRRVHRVSHLAAQRLDADRCRHRTGEHPHRPVGRRGRSRSCSRRPRTR